VASGTGEDPREPLPGVRAPGVEEEPTSLAPSTGPDLPTPREDTRIAAADPAPQPTGLVVVAPAAVPAAEAISPAEAPGQEAATAHGGYSRRTLSPEATDLGTTLRTVLVVGQGEDGELAAAFRPAEGDALSRFEEGSQLGAEAAPAFPEEPTPPEPDPDTGIAPPRPVLRTAPEMGERLREAHRREALGPLALRLRVIEDGTVAGVEPLPGSSSGLPWLDRAVTDAVAGWEFLPAELHGEPMPVVIELVVEFDLE
jgi:outer membrane biosynthesis protein TonB